MSKSTATAIVEVTVRVSLTQPWGGTETLENVQKIAKREAKDRLNSMAEEMGRRGIYVDAISSVQIILNKEVEP